MTRRLDEFRTFLVQVAFTKPKSSCAVEAGSAELQHAPTISLSKVLGEMTGDCAVPTMLEVYLVPWLSHKCRD